MLICESVAKNYLSINHSFNSSNEASISRRCWSPDQQLLRNRQLQNYLESYVVGQATNNGGRLARIKSVLICESVAKNYLSINYSFNSSNEASISHRCWSPDQQLLRNRQLQNYLESYVVGQATNNGGRLARIKSVLICESVAKNYLSINYSFNSSNEASISHRCWSPDQQLLRNRQLQNYLESYVVGQATNNGGRLARIKSVLICGSVTKNYLSINHSFNSSNEASISRRRWSPDQQRRKISSN